MQSILDKHLPQEIVSNIYEYTECKLRNGKYMCQLDKNMEIFNLLSNRPIFSNGRVELLIRWIKIKGYCEKKIKIEYKKNDNQYHIKIALDEMDWKYSKNELTVYDNYLY